MAHITSETVCITRSGFNFAHGERCDLAAKVHYHLYEAREPFRGARYIGGPTACELFVPRLVNGAPDWNTL